MSSNTPKQRAIAVLLLIFAINFSLLSATLGALCYVLEIRPATTLFLEMCGMATMTALWLGYRIKRMEIQINSQWTQWVYTSGILLSFVLAALASFAFGNSVSTNHWIHLVILSNGLFLVLCIGIKLNDLKYSLD